MAQFTNQAQLSYNNTVVNSNVVVGEILEVVSGNKTAIVDTYAANGTVTYAISIVNVGSTAITNLSISDNLGAYTQGGETRIPLTYVDGSLLYYVNGVVQASPTVTATQPLTVSGINVPAGGSRCRN